MEILPQNQAQKQHHPALRVLSQSKTHEPPFVLVEGEAILQPVLQFLKLLCLRDLSTQTLRAYAYDLLAFYRFLRKIRVDIHDLSSKHFTDFILALKKQNAAPRTINRRLIVIVKVPQKLIEVTMTYLHLSLKDVAKEYHLALQSLQKTYETTQRQTT